MNISYNWRSKRPDVIGLVSEALFFIVGDVLHFGEYHCNGHFYSFDKNSDKTIFPAKEVFVWCYKNEVVING